MDEGRRYGAPFPVLDEAGFGIAILHPAIASRNNMKEVCTDG
ncbi:hypothetical protein [Acetobacter fallax]|nr:hypothetical protein [Acetobacter fallax]